MQEERILQIKTALGDDAVVVHRFQARQELGRLSEVELELLSTRNDLAFGKILGTNASIKLEVSTNKVRHFNGVVTRFSHTGFTVGRYHQYRASVRSWPWLLTRTADCRIFQGKTVPEIIKEIFKKYADAKFEDKLAGSYQPRDYCVQYRETDFNFISRLMEQEGMYYFFKHEDGKHTMVLADSSNAHEPAAGFEETPFITADRTALAGAACLTRWDHVGELQSGRYVLTDYDFTKPKADLAASQKQKREHALAEFEFFDYPGEYVDPDLGKRYARTRIEECQWRHELGYARATARGLCAGSTFKMKGHPRAELNREYLIVAEDVQGENNVLDSGAKGGAWCESSVTLLSNKEVFRPSRTTPHPFVQGPQTAVVVGPSGEEIWTDKYGRVKVQFHWDRYGKRDENSSCWVRVSHPWAGSNWGMVAIPRIGQEVVVDFLEGDPDQPLITGRVYNADQMPPYELPANATQSGVKSRSSKGGAAANANEIRMEDKKGSEQLLIHAEKNQDIEVENDETHWVGHDRTKTIDHDETVHVKHDRTETVDHDEKITIGRDRSMTIGQDKSEKVARDKAVEVGRSHNEVIGKNMNVDVGMNLSETVALNYAETVGAAMELTVGGFLNVSVGGVLTESVGGAKGEAVGGNKSENIGQSKTVDIGKNLSESITENQTVEIGKDLTETIEGKHQEAVTKEYMLKAKKIQLVADDEISIKTGSAEVVMKKNGDITINGAKINVKGSGDVVIKGSQIKEN